MSNIIIIIKSLFIVGLGVGYFLWINRLIMELNNFNFINFMGITPSYTFIEKSTTPRANEISIHNKSTNISCPGISNVRSKCYTNGQSSILCLAEINDCYNGEYNNTSFLKIKNN